jgi:hypothetical protein
VPLIDLFLDKLTWNTTRTVLTTWQHNPSFGILLAFSISNVGLTYKTIANEMPSASAEDAKKSLCKGNLTDLRRELHLSLAKGDPKRTL